jgi:hypothetical protein
MLYLWSVLTSLGEWAQPRILPQSFRFPSPKLRAKCLAQSPVWVSCRKKKYIHNTVKHIVVLTYTIHIPTIFSKPTVYQKMWRCFFKKCFPQFHHFIFRWIFAIFKHFWGIISLVIFFILQGPQKNALNY